MSQSQHELAASGKCGYCSLGEETLTIYNYRTWERKKKKAFPLSVPPSKTEPDLKLKLHSMQHQCGCKPITGLHTPTVWGVKGPPTCQVPLQGERGALVPTVAAAEEEPDQEGGQHQN